VRLLLVGSSEVATTLAGELSAELTLERWAEDAPAGEGAEQVAQIARDLRDLERSLDDGGADAVLVVSDSSAALAAVLVATKLGVPVACLERLEDADGHGANQGLIGQLADAALAPDPGVIVEWARAGYPARQ
jgi:UDP-N-acetylglucosamine 2-epimerase